MIIDINLVGEELHVHVNTEKFNLRDTPDAVGETWVGLCKAINGYLNSHGLPHFDCMTAHKEN